MRGFLIALMASCSLAACTDSKTDTKPSPSPRMHILHGTFDATGDCIAEKQGFPITIEDQDGNVIATGTTKPDTSPTKRACVSTFSVNVPDVPSYSIRMGPWLGPTYTNAELSSMDWTLDLSIS